MTETQQAKFDGWGGLRYAAPEKLAYVAGIFDGEGCISIQRNKPHAGGKSPCYALHVSVSNTDKRIINFLLELVGGGSCKHNNEKRPNQRLCYDWRVQARVAVRFLKAIRPYLLLKAEQADLAIEFWSRIHYGSRRLSSEELDTRDSLRLRLVAMKGRIRSANR